MTRHNPPVPRFMKPGPDLFVGTALSSLGWAGRTCGWPWHSFFLSYLPRWLVPDWVYRPLARAVMGRYRRHCEELAKDE